MLEFFSRVVAELLLRLDAFHATHVRAKHFRNDERTVFLLVVVADADHHARGGEAGTVQRMHERVLAANLRLDVGAASLVVFEVRAGADFEPLLFDRGVDFEVVALGGTETEVALAEGQAVVGEAELFEEHFAEAGELFVVFVATFRVGEVDHLDLVELVQAEESAGVLAVGTGFTAEAGGVGADALREFGFRNHFAGVKVGQRHFCGRDEEQVVVLVAAVHVFFELRELARAAHGIAGCG